MFPDTPTRSKIDLSGPWSYSSDGKTWNPVSVPSSFDFPGKIIFSRTFGLTPEKLSQGALSLVAYGINYQCEVSVNGNFIGRHIGGYTSFVLPVPSNFVRPGNDNSITIVVDNELTASGTLPLRQQVGGWRSYGGIFRDIYLLITPGLSVEEAQVSYESPGEDKPVKVSVQASISQRGAATPAQPDGLLGFQVEIDDKLSGELAGRSGIIPITPPGRNKSAKVSAELVVASPKFWSPDVPDLYVCRFEIVRVVHKEASVIDEADQNIGFRDFRWIDGRLAVNGAVVPLKGIEWREDHFTYGSSLTYEVMEKDVALIKTLGANLIRFPCPPHPYMLNLCDRYGILAMEDIPLVGASAEVLSRDYFQDLETSYLREMVSRDREHVSVLAWGIGDELDVSGSGSCDEVSQLRNIVKSLDPRPVYFTTMAGDNPCTDHVDMIALNASQKDSREFRESLKSWKDRAGDRPVLVIRYGREAEPGNHNGYSDPASMESQARAAVQAFEIIRDTKVAGGVLRAFSDWRTDRPALSTQSHDPFVRTMGILSYEREKRTAYDVVHALFNGEKLPALPVGNYSTNAPIVYVVSGIAALISFFFMYNGNRRFRDCVNRSLRHTYNFFADLRDQRILNYSHSLFLAIIIAVTWATIVSSVFSHYRSNLVLDNFLSEMMSDSLKVRFIQLVWHPVKFILLGAASILALLLVLSILVRVLSAFIHGNVRFYHAVSVTIWSTLPYVVLIPAAMILYRLSMETDAFMMPFFLTAAVITFWVGFRLLKGVSIIYDIFPAKVYLAGVVLLIVATALLYGYLDFTHSGSVYLRHIVQAVKSSI